MAYNPVTSGLGDRPSSDTVPGFSASSDTVSVVFPSVIKYGYSYQHARVVGQSGDSIQFMLPNMAMTRSLGLSVQAALAGSGSIDVSVSNANFDPAQIGNSNIPWVPLNSFTANGIEFYPGPFIAAQVVFTGTAGQAFFTLTS